MTQTTFTDTDAQAVRSQWFSYLDTIESERGALHAYCLKLTKNIWDAEDLLQETLLRGFAMTARGDLHGDSSPVRNARAYLFRVATNQWIDLRRKTRLEVAGEHAEVPVDDVDRVATAEAVQKAAALSSPQEFAAMVLKEGYDFTLEEVADFVGTTVGTVKSALARARRKMQQTDVPRAETLDPEVVALSQAFAEAINDGDLDRVKSLMAESMNIVVCNVGGGRGPSGVWTEKSVPGTIADYAECVGEPVIVLRSEETGVAYDVIRLEGDDGRVTKITDYCYAPETLALAAKALQIEIDTMGYHQPASTIREMVATTRLPWLT